MPPPQISVWPVQAPTNSFHPEMEVWQQYDCEHITSPHIRHMVGTLVDGSLKRNKSWVKLRQPWCGNFAILLQHRFDMKSNFGKIKTSKKCNFDTFRDFTLWILVILSFAKIAKIYQNQNSEPLKWPKLQFSSPLNCQFDFFRKNCMALKFIFPTELGICLKIR